MQIEFKILKAHICQDSTCFKTTFVLVKNMTDRVILGNPFMCLLYPFITDSEGITTHPFGQPVKFKFLKSPKPREISNLQEVSVSMTLNLINAKTSPPTFPNQAKNLDQFVPSIPFDDSLNLNQFHKLSSYPITCIQHKSICSMTSHDFNKNVFKGNHYVNSWQKWNMSSSSSRRDKGKAPVGGFPQKMHEGTSSGSEPRKATSLQNSVLAKITFSSGYMAITLQKVLSKALQFTNGVYTNLPPSIKIILDNPQRAFTQNNYNLFKRTLRALELQLVNLEVGNEVNEILISQLLGKEDIHSMDKMTIMGTDYARLSLKTQNQLRSVVANLPTDIQVRILGSKAMFESCD